MLEHNKNVNKSEDIKKIELTLRGIIKNNDYFEDNAEEFAEELTPQEIQELKSYFSPK